MTVEAIEGQTVCIFTTKVSLRLGQCTKAIMTVIDFSLRFAINDIEYDSDHDSIVKFFSPLLKVYIANGRLT